MRFKSFVSAFSVQKALELALLSTCIAIQTYIRTPGSAASGGGETSYNVWDVAGAKTVAGLAFYIFTLYFVVAFAMVALARGLVGRTVPNLVPWWSAVVSIAYAVFWTVHMGVAVSVAAYWITIALMGGFVLVSSAVFYPPVPMAPRGLSGFARFILAFSTQKLLELVLLTVCMATQFYIGSRMADPMSWGASGPTPYSFWCAVQGGVGISILFFLFTLYPVMTFVMVALGRNFLGKEAPRLVPWLSAAISVGYVLYWVWSLKFDFTLPYWIVTAIMGVFIVTSSAMLYPPVASPRH